MATVKLVLQDIDELEAPYADDMDSLGTFSFDDDTVLESKTYTQVECTFGNRGHDWGQYQKPVKQWERNSKGSCRWVRGDQRYE